MHSSLRVQVPDHPRGPIYTTVDGRNPALPLGTLSYGNYGICLIMGNAGFRSSTGPLSPLGFSVQGIQFRVYIYSLLWNWVPKIILIMVSVTYFR